jgi:phosphatidylserine/phosphatidylglycerophosphate/cardiolipin synthase-like enzyme
MKFKTPMLAAVAGIVALNSMAFNFPLTQPSVKLVKAVKKELAEDATSMQSVPAQLKFEQGASYQLCFVPNGVNCEALLVNAINATQKSLLIQAYSFTSAPIAKAVARAHERGVKVSVVVDKSQVSEKYTSATFLKNAGIPVVIDSQPAIAHNKVMIFDASSVFTGSFNFTSSAANRNAENGILIHGDNNIARAYTKNWQIRHDLSKPY